MSRKEKKEALKKVNISALQQMDGFKLLSTLIITSWQNFNPYLTGSVLALQAYVFCGRFFAFDKFCY